MPIITNFGDTNTTGNVTLSQNLTVQGSFAIFYGSILTGSGNSTLGNVANPFSNLYATNANISNINTTSIFGTSGFVGIGTTNPNATLHVQGNIYASNAFQMTNLVGNAMSFQVANVTSMNVITIAAGVGIGTTALSGTTLYVNGNLFAQNINTVSLNATSIFAPTGFLGIGTTAPSGTSLFVSGNMYVTNALTVTNLFTTTANAGTVNALSFITQTAFNGPTTAFTLANSLTISNAVVTNNVIASGTITYGEDLYKRGPYLLPSQANAVSIQGWISATCNAASQPAKSWWSTSALPVSANVATTGGSIFFGSLLLPDGRVMFCPSLGGVVGFYTPTTGLYSTVPVGTATTYRGGVLTPTGNVVMLPWAGIANASVFNTISYLSSNISLNGASNPRIQGGVLLPNGNIIGTTNGGSNVITINPTTFLCSNVSPINTTPGGGAVLLPNGNVFLNGGGANGNAGVYNYLNGNFTNVAIGPSSYQSAVLAQNGNVIGLPWNGGNVISCNPLQFTVSNIPTNVSLIGGCLLPSGNIVCAPSGFGPNIGMVDPINLTYSNIPASMGSMAGCTLLPSGQVVFVPGSASANVGLLNTMTPAPIEFCLGPYLNKL
jgi:hypothetical protein